MSLDFGSSTDLLNDFGKVTCPLCSRRPFSLFAESTVWCDRPWLLGEDEGEGVECRCSEALCLPCR